jgi:signal transduction histidine kinase
LKLSLSWRIAIAYAILLLVTLGAISGVTLWRVQVILYSQARERTDATMQAIVAQAQPSNPYPFGDLANVSLLQVFNSNNLAIWQSPTTFIQVDTTGGYPIARSPNLGATNIPLDNDVTAAHPRGFRKVEIQGRPFLVEDQLLHGATFAVVVHVADSLDSLNRTFAQTQQTIIVIIASAGIAVVILSFVLAAQATGPIARLTAAIGQIGSEGLSQRIPGGERGDEIGELTRSFNDLLGRLQEAFARERQFISDASHELKTPLTSINANAQLLLRWGDRDETIRRESLETIASESSMLAEMVNGMLTLAKADRGDEIPKEPVSLSMVAQEAARGASGRAADKGLTLTVNAPSPSPLVEGDPHLIRQLVSNLIDNAIKFTNEGGVIVTVDGDARSAWIQVDDTGPGIPDDELANVFERFYRADKARSRDVPGTGLGLAIVRSISRVHGGHVEAGRAAGGGARFCATFPRIDDSLTESS